MAKHTKYPKIPKYISNGDNISKSNLLKIRNGHDISIARSSKRYQNLNFLDSNIPSGNPATDAGFRQHLKSTLCTKFSAVTAFSVAYQIATKFRGKPLFKKLARLFGEQILRLGDVDLNEFAPRLDPGLSGG
jgi:hypothetical protein